MTRQHGISLIELMVSLALGMLLLTGTVNVFIDYQRAYRMQTQLAQLQESGRFVLDVIGRELRKAGYTDYTADNNGGQAFPASAAFMASAFIAGGSDTLAVRYQGSTHVPMQDCLGGEIDSSGWVAASFSLDEASGLRCAVDADPPQPLDGHVEAMSLRYFSHDGWRSAAQISDWHAVRGVHVELLLRSSMDGITRRPETYTFAGKTVTAKDHRLRRVYTTTVMLRNYQPEDAS